MTKAQDNFTVDKVLLVKLDISCDGEDDDDDEDDDEDNLIYSDCRSKIIVNIIWVVAIAASDSPAAAAAQAGADAGIIIVQWCFIIDNVIPWLMITIGIQMDSHNK